LLRKTITTMIAVQMLFCSGNSFAEAEKAATDKEGSGKATAGAGKSDAAGAAATGAATTGTAPAGAATTGAATTGATASTAAEQPASDRIVAVRVKGNTRIDTATIMQAVRIKPGERLDRELVDADVRAIFKLGHFRDVQAHTEKGEGGIVLEYVVVEKPVIREIKIQGAKEVKQDKVREAIEIKPNTIYSAKDLPKSIKKVKKLYTDEGYYLVEVNAFTSKRSETELNLIFEVKEGEKILIKTIEFDGNHAFTSKQLKKVMETSEQWMFSWLTGAGTYKEEQLKNDVALVGDYYMNNGYINVKVGEPKVALLPDKSGLKVTIGITEGEQYKVGKLGFKGELLESEDVLMKKLKEKSGETFSRATLRADINTLTDVYADKGYAFANASPVTAVHPDSKTMDITFDMEKGSKVHIDRINVTGNTKTRDKVVRRELRLDEGDLYSSTALKRSKQNLMNTGFFEEANLVTAKGSTPEQLDLNVEVKEKPTGTFSVGAGYSSLDGVIGQGSVSQANFLGLGLKATAAVGWGSKSKTYNLGLTDPYFLDSKWTLGADVYRNEQQYIDYTHRATGGDIKAGYPFSDTLSTFWIYKYEVREIFDESQALLESIHAGAILPPVTNSTTSSITGSISSNTTDYRLDPSSGFINTLSTEFAGLGGTNRFLRYITENTVFYPVGWGTVVSLKGTLGYIQSLGKEIPIDEKFYLGGIGSLRGFNPRTVCPNLATTVTSTDINGIGTTSTNRVYLGGDAEAVANLEYTFPLIKEAGVKGVTFFDVGNSGDTFASTFSTIRASYGGGIRWLSPIGPLRLEWGVPINPRSGIDHRAGRFEFAIGSIF